MKVITEHEALALATPLRAYDAVRAALIAAADGTGIINPVVFGPGIGPGDVFGVKSGSSRSGRVIGAKIGGYWPRNDTFGLDRHVSVVVLLDPDTGRAIAIIEASAMNGRRTAAADAVAADVLARSDARTLSLIGAGAQARYEAEAIVRIRPIERVLIASRNHAHAEAMAIELKTLAPRVEAVTVRVACEGADILVTATAAKSPLFEASWIAPGTHISAMGADQVGKQELPPSLLMTSRLYADWPKQSIEIGEFQHLLAGEADVLGRVAAIGDVFQGLSPGRVSDHDITIFDSSGLALQDLYVAAAVLEASSIDAENPMTGSAERHDGR
jgi:ornithine cyclodeaminase